MNENIFQRVEKKYMVSKKQYECLIETLKNQIERDKYFYNTICNVYYDTENNELIKKSIEKPVYKEKFRIRSYGTPKNNTEIFIELKKKYKDIVYKRRIKLNLLDAYTYLETGKIDNITDENTKQIKQELDFCMARYKLKPAIYLSYERYAYKGIENSDFRITFDTNIQYRKDNLKLEYGTNGKRLLEDDVYLMEVKTLGALPIWFAKTLSELNIYPKSFSKYGNVYKELQNENYYIKKVI